MTGLHYIIVVMAAFIRVSFRLVFHQSNCVSPVKHIISYYHISVFVLVRVFVCSLLLPCML